MYGQIIQFPKRTQATLQKVVNVYVSRGEGPIKECGTSVNVASWAMASAVLAKWAETAPELGYEKCDFVVTWEDGEEYRGRYDLKRHDTRFADLGGHVAGFVRFHAGLEKPDHMSEEQYSRYLEDQDAKMFADWLGKYEVAERFEPGEVARLLKQEEEERKAAEQSEREQLREQKRRKDEEAKERGRELYAKLCPSWAKAVIVAEDVTDQSDIMSDYHGSTTSQLTVLAWSKHTRDLFKEMRKAAALLPDTAHLGPGMGQFSPRVVLAEDVGPVNGSCYWKGQRSPWHHELDEVASHAVTLYTKAEAEAFIAEKGQPHEMTLDGKPATFEWQIHEEEIEHREKWSMGAGYYLKAGYRHGNGWQVRKFSLAYGSDAVCLALGYGRAVKEVLEPKTGGKKQQIREEASLTRAEMTAEIERLTAENARLKGEER